jgi:hypothetical protein
MQSTIPGQKNIARKGVEDANGDMIKVGDTVRHNSFGRDAVVTSTHTAVVNGARYNEIDIDAASGPWDPKDVRKVTPDMELKRRR